MPQDQNSSRTITHESVLFTMISRELRTEGQKAMSDGIKDLQFGDTGLCSKQDAAFRLENPSQKKGS